MAIAPPQVRHLDIAVLRDVRLGALRADPEMLLEYLRSVKPATLVLTGEIADAQVFMNGRLSTGTLRVVLRLGQLAAAGTRIYLIAEQEPSWLPANSNLLHPNCAVRKELLLHQGGEKYYFGRDRTQRGVLRRVRTWLAGPKSQSSMGSMTSQERIAGARQLARTRACTTCILLDNRSALNCVDNDASSSVNVVAPASWTATRAALELRFGQWTNCEHASEPKALTRIVALPQPVN